MADTFGSATDLVPLLTGSSVDQVASRELCTLVLTDLVDSGRMLTEIGDRRALDVGTRHDQITRDLLHRHGGREIDKSDGFLLLFRRAVEAVSFALDYHAALAKLSKEEDVDLRTRVGIHMGEVYLRLNPAEEVRQGAKQVEVESTLTCQGYDCRVDLRLIRGSDGGVERSYEVGVPGDDLMTAAVAVGTGLRQLYPKERLRAGHGQLEVAPQDQFLSSRPTRKPWAFS